MQRRSEQWRNLNPIPSYWENGEVVTKLISSDVAFGTNTTTTNMVTSNTSIILLTYSTLCMLILETNISFQCLVRDRQNCATCKWRAKFWNSSWNDIVTTSQSLEDNNSNKKPVRQRIASCEFVIVTNEKHIAWICCTETQELAQERKLQLLCTKASPKIISRNFQKPNVANTLRRIDLFTIPRWRRGHHHHNLHSAGAISMHLSQLREENKRIKQPTSTFNAGNSWKALLHCFLHTRNRVFAHLLPSRDEKETAATAQAQRC